ncbi:MAG: hypothetical protein GF341_02770 [candidate division Zixibacteria bacterium]|nr:hypothetical protein [candidate division Zixibacteria bacterium]
MWIVSQKESTYGTAVAPGAGVGIVKHTLPPGTQPILRTKNVLSNKDYASGNRHETNRIFLEQMYDGPLSLWLSPESFGQFFGYALGKDTKSPIGTGGVEHLLVPETDANDASIPSFTLYEYLPEINSGTDSVWTLSGMMVEEVTLRVTPQTGIMTIQATLRGSGEDNADANLSSYDSDTNDGPIYLFTAGKVDVFINEVIAEGGDVWEEGTFTDPTTAGYPGGVDDLEDAKSIGKHLVEVTVTYRNTFDNGHGPGSGQTGSGRARRRSIRQDYEVVGTITHRVDSTHSWIRDRFEELQSGEQEFAMQISGVGDEFIDTGETTYCGWSLIVPLARFDQEGQGRSDSTREPLSRTMPFTAQKQANHELIEAAVWDKIDENYGNAG